MERKQLFATMEKIHALSNRVSANICQRIKTRTGLDKLDELLTLGERSHALYMRVYARYQATETEEMKAFWER